MPSFEPHPDPIVRDLQAVRRLRWARPEQFGRLETLLTHPLVNHFAFQPKKERQRVKALEAALREVVERIQEKEGDDPPLGRSVADAATALLRLSPEFERMALEEIREHIAATWARQGGGSLSPNGFRLHLEVPGVYEPVAAAFREFAREQWEDYSPKEPLEGEAESLEDEEPVEEGSGEEVPATASVGEALQLAESRIYREHQKEIGEGMMRIRSEEEMIEVLLTLTQVAKREFHAVDYVDISEWFGSPRLNRYLMKQLDRVEKEGISLTRIRVVHDEELQYEKRSREQLERFVELHKRAGAKLLLCRDKTVKKLKEDFELRFAPHVGLFLIDSAGEPAGVTGKLSSDGAIGRARVYVGDHSDLRKYKSEYQVLERTAVEQNATVREELESLR
jgi:hypothetical protein